MSTLWKLQYPDKKEKFESEPFPDLRIYSLAIYQLR